MPDTERQGPRKLSDEELTVAAGTIPLPPEALWDELDNSGTPSAKVTGDAPAAREVAVLDYVDGAPGTTVPLAHPFRLDGRVVKEIAVRPLSVEETAQVVRQAPDVGRIDSVDFYAAMTGLPVPVLRALRGTDGEAVTDACFVFLPRFMKGSD